jgi:Ca-activated chloride channel family protein
MNRTHALLALAAVLTLFTTLDLGRSRLFRPEVVQPRGTSQSKVLSLEVKSSHALAPAEGGELFARVDLKAVADEREAPRAPVRMVLVLDRSGSMHGEKMEQARTAALHMVDLLRDGDSLGIVHFGTGVESHRVVRTDVEGRAMLRAFLTQMQDEGSTNISGALEAARALLTEAGAGPGNQRIVLVSDGQPTAGITDTAGLTRLAGTLHEAGIAVSAMGVGVDFNSTLMTTLAEVGGGFYAYLNQARELDGVLKQEVDQARAVVARNVVLRLTPAPGVQVLDVPGRTFTRRDGALLVQLPDFAPGATAQVFVQLATQANAVPERGVLSLQLDDVDARSGARGVTTAGLALPTGGAAAFEASRDEEVYASGLRAVGGRQMVLAAQAFKEGNRDQAFAMLDNVRRLFGKSADALAGDSEVTTKTLERWRGIGSNDSAAIGHEANSLEKKSMKSFGQNNTY